MNERDGAYEYALKVVSGEILACESVRQNCLTFKSLFEKIESGEITDIRYNNKMLNNFYLVSKGLRHYEGFAKLIGTSVVWELWQQYIFGNIYGLEIYDEELDEWVWLHREILIYCAKKQGKSFMSAGIMLYDCGYCLDSGAKCFIFGVDANTATIPFENCGTFIKNDDDLSADFTAVGRRIYSNYDRSCNIQLIPKMSKSENFDGKNIFSALCEELHTMDDGGTTYDVFKRGTSARSNSHIISITTAGADKFSFCNQQYNVFKDITKEGDFYSPRWGLIYEQDKGDDWRDEKVWIKSNPNLGVSKRLSHFYNSLKEIEKTPSLLNRFLTKDLNIWVDNVEAWLNSEKLDALFTDIDTSTLDGKRCFLGVDLARKRDLSAVSAVFPEQPGIDEPVVWAFPFIDADSCAEREEACKVPFSQWIEKGWVSLTDGDEINFEEIENFIVEFAKTHNVECVYFDPAFAQMMMQRLSKFGITVKEFAQNGKNYTDVIQSFETRVNTGKIRFVRNDCLRWCFYNVEIKTFADKRLMPNKRGNPNKKIDVAIASLLAYKGIIDTPAEKKSSSEAYLIAKGYVKNELGKWVKPAPPSTQN